MSTWALVPIKSPSACKARLAGVLGPDGRARLARAMLADVLGHLRGVAGLDGVAVVSPMRGIGGADVRSIDDPGGGLNDALAHALAVLGRDGASRVLLVAADTPLTSSFELAALLAAGHDSELVLVPDRQGAGTNAIFMTPPALLAPAFGRDSFARHASRAASLGLASRALSLPGLGQDIDTPQDLDLLRARVAHRASYDFLGAPAGVH